MVKMELRSPKAKKKPNFHRLTMWTLIPQTLSILMLCLLGTINCEFSEQLIDNSVPKLNTSSIQSAILLNDNGDTRWRPNRHDNDMSQRRRYHELLSDIRFLRRHLNKEIVNFVMTDTLVDGEVENRVHYNGVTAKETYVGGDGSGLKLRQLTDGRHLVQVIYAQNGEIQDCEYITEKKRARNFLKQLRNELKQALNELNDKVLNLENKSHISDERNEKYLHNFENVTFRLLKSEEILPAHVAEWLNYDELKYECLKRHEELKYMLENRNKVTEHTLARSRRSIREHFIVPGTKWCGAGQLAQTYNELGTDKSEDKCCRSHDHCRMNIGPFRRRFGYFNLTPFTVSHCRCDRRFRACLKLADTSVSNMVGKVFFNVVQTKCFILKPVKICTQRSWWGKCLKKGRTKQAFLRDNLPY